MVKMKGSILELFFHRLLTRPEYKKAIWCIAHRLARLIWKILHQGLRYEDTRSGGKRQGPADAIGENDPRTY